ncbi:glycosyltransferase family 39 protein [Candidatus Gottesmanbacteria bacterium]|nr:glycosyltransferase family 39 protein [Candidatus Gottesmanbacteria bacterium]
MSKKFSYFCIFIIVLVAAWLRLWQLGQVPPSPDWDEAALGYNAYSVLKTGRDEYGTWFPLTLRSFDDYKPPLYMYLTVPSVALFGLNTWAVRLPSVIAGILAVIGTYFLTQELLKRANKESLFGIPVTAMLLLAISPWHIQFSRIAFEANIGVTINIWAVVFFLKGVLSRRWLSVSAFLFGLGFYAYHSERIFLPLLLVILVLNYRKELFRMRVNVVIAAIVGLMTVAPLVPVFMNQNTLMRLRGTSSLADQTGLLARSVWKLEEDQKANNPWGVMFDNRRIVWIKTLTSGYLSHYSLRWLFLTGDNARHHAPDMGLLYLAELPFLLWGMFILARQRGRQARIIFGWFLIAPIAASPTTELPHAIRTLVFLPTFQIFTAVGLINFYKRYFKYKDYILRLFVTALFAVNVLYYLHMYFGHLNEEYSSSWQYGYAQAVEYTKIQKDRYKKIVVSTKLEQPHMFFLYFLKYDPVKYLAKGGTSSGGFAEVRNTFDIYEFRPIHWDTDVKDGTVLYIGTPGEIPGPGLMTIRYLDGKEAIKIAD